MQIDVTTYRETFFAEAGDHLAALEAILLRLEAKPSDPEAVADAFRAAHSVKGGADAVGLPEIARFTHALEGLLDQARSRPDPLSRAKLDLLLEAVDILGQLLTASKAGGTRPAAADTVQAQLVAALAPPVEYAVRLAPHPDAFRSGLDPFPLLRELVGMGEHVRTVLDPRGLPPLDQLDPERCYLAWTVHLRTTHTPADLESLFAFARDNVQVTITPVEAAQPTKPPVPGVVPPAVQPPTVPAQGAAPTPTGSAPLPPPSNERAGLIADFCGEATEHLEAADQSLLRLDETPTDREALNALYRGFHTIKGVSSMLGMDAVRTLAHEAENLLNLARDGQIVLHGPALELVFASVDIMKRQIMAARDWAIARVPLPPDPAIPGLLAALRKVCEKGIVEPAAPVSPPVNVPPLIAPTTTVAPAAMAAVPPAAPHASPSPPTATETPKGRRPTDKETVRVDKDRLDKLINTIGELVIAQSMAQEEFDELTRRTGGHSPALGELSKISRDLQELSLSLRMVPLAGTFQKLARLVRDLSKKIGKPVELELQGEETELDKTVVDQLGDPLMHMVRNAIDHGLESPEGRAKAGKSASGHITLRAYHQGGNVYIELADDGRGLDRERILQKAVEKGIVAADARLSDAEVYALIFEPGFSTAAAVTEVSGRGVGMDVVRRNVESLQGSILIRTRPGQGTTFTIRLPLTLAIVDGLVVGLGDDVYVIPLLSVMESFRPRAADLRTVVGRGEVVAVRGETVPLLRLHRLLNRPAEVTDPCRGLVVLVEDQGRQHALLVDDLLGQMQAVVKSLDANYRRVEGLAGATILGDGRVAMILDVHGLARLHGSSDETRRRTPALAGSNDFTGEI